MQSGEMLEDKVSGLFLKSLVRFCSQNKKSEETLKTPPDDDLFKGSKPTKQFSSKDAIKVEMLDNLFKYAKVMNREGTLLKMPPIESHNECNRLTEFSVLRAPRSLNNTLLDGFTSLFDRRVVVKDPQVYPYYLTGFLLT